MSIAPKEPASPRTRNAHALCLKRSGNNGYGDIPLSISIATVAPGERSSGPKAPITIRRLHIQPDSARLLNAELVSDDFYDSIRNSADVVTEGEGAERLFAALGALHARPAAGEQSPALRYSMRGACDMQLMRNYLGREGYGRLSAEATRNATRTIDVRHALMMIAGVCRATESWQTLPGKLRDYDLDCRELAAVELCGFYGVALPDDGSESSALLTLVLAAHEAAGRHGGLESAGRKAAGSGLLKTLGNALDDLEGATGLPAVEKNVELLPSRTGLLLHKGKWIPVVRPMTNDSKSGSDYCLYSLPEGRALLRPVHISAPLLRLDRLETQSGWTADADDRLRRICGREGEPFSFRSLREAFARADGGWRPPESNLIPLPTAESNPWTQLQEFPPGEEQYAISGKAALAINRRDIEGARIALDDIARHAENGNQYARGAARILLRNMRLAASRADLLNDGRKAWLGQMALLLDPEAWPADLPANSLCFAALLYGDGPVARHNRIAIGSRSALGIPASNAVMQILIRRPRLQAEDAGCA